MAHSFNIEPPGASFGAVVTGLTLARIDDDTWRARRAIRWLKRR